MNAKGEGVLVVSEANLAEYFEPQSYWSKIFRFVNYSCMNL